MGRTKRISEGKGMRIGWLVAFTVSHFNAKRDVPSETHHAKRYHICALLQLHGDNKYAVLLRYYVIPSSGAEIRYKAALMTCPYSSTTAS